MDNRELLRLKDRIEKLEKEVAQDEGSLRQMMSDLKDQGYESIEDAEKKLKDLEEDIAAKEDEYREQVQEIEEKMSAWDD